MAFENVFLESAISKFRFQKSLGETTFSQLEEKDLFYKASPESNSIAVIVHHMAGNMLSRWTNFLTEDGEKPWRDRDKEFEDVLETKNEVIDLWKRGWECVFNAVENLAPEDVMKTIVIRRETMPVVDAIIRQLDHYGYHVGQIVLIGKIVKDKNWETLSIPKGRSREF